MIEQVLVAIEGSAPVAALRQSIWAYPLVNAGHILGVALLVGGIVPLDLRLLGAWRAYPVAPFLHVLRATSALGLGLAIFCGLLLFATAATDYVHSWWFLSKMTVVLLGVINALFIVRVLANEDIQSLPLCSTMPASLRFGALISLLVWPVALVLGRFVGYF
ncbi:hypothetical protein RE428_16270 [Marinobacter nanhaiticus D15-8W]|uniref:DUF2214 domain-containing protein n=1 Tax=Marinobacter nanhaiticus D15-8W TaxID=626887 RepID=N6WNZ9_9GAMM|nr:hypothetical protein [Marinobacter nanhaiticus]ENO13246.1 hypothetical protein J057_17660 [Marinobacter nanhaiticus D15-8W]BES70609.1 hypothetical protein RE428_16270 [Marinobacter nanhaiticus D15-8W]